MRTKYIVSVVLILIVSWWMWAELSTTIAVDLGGRPADIALERAGQWGDSFGAFSALVSTLGFAAVLATLWMQGDALREQQRDQHKQRFESSFFQLLELMRQARREVRFGFSLEFLVATTTTRKRSNKTVTGPEAIMCAIIELRHWMSAEGVLGRRATRSQLSDLYLKRVHGRYESTFGPYFRLIYTVLFRIRDDAILSEGEKARYANLLRSQLTSYEISLIAINGLAPIAKDLSDLLTEFRLLKYLPVGAMRRTLEAVYVPDAFAARD